MKGSGRNGRGDNSDDSTHPPDLAGAEEQEALAGEGRDAGHARGAQLRSHHRRRRALDVVIEGRYSWGPEVSGFVGFRVSCEGAQV